MCFPSQRLGERANTSLSADGFPCEHLFPWSTSTSPLLQTSSGLYTVQICYITGEDTWIFPSLPARTHPHEEDRDWYVQAVCNRLPCRHLKCAWRKPFFHSPLSCSTCKMEILPEGAEVHILDNRGQLSLSAQQRADRGMPALPAHRPGWMWARSPAETPSPCWQQARVALPVSSSASLASLTGLGLLLHQYSCMASGCVLARAPPAWGTPLLSALFWRKACTELLWAAQYKKPSFLGSYCIW